jgi:hypothetical protein
LNGGFSPEGFEIGNVHNNLNIFIMESAGASVDEVEDNPPKRLKSLNANAATHDGWSKSEDENMKVCLMCTCLHQSSSVDTDCLCGKCYDSFATSHIDNTDISILSACLEADQPCAIEIPTANPDIVDDEETGSLSQIAVDESQAEEGVDLFM